MFEAFLSAYLLIMLIRMFYSLYSGFLYVRPNQNKNKVETLASVIIPAWNEAIGIGKTIESVIASTYKNIELIIVDDGSTDNTFEKAIQIKDKYPDYDIKIIKQANQGKANALNNGVEQANGSLILTVDADSYLDPEAIGKLVYTLSDKQYDVAIGQVVVAKSNSFIGMIQFFEYIFGFHLKKSQHIFNSIYIFPGALTAIRKNTLEKVGLFEDYSSTEDLDLSMKVKISGSKAAYVDDAICITEGAADIKGLINQRTRWRHGFIDCVLHQREFITDVKKGFYLTLVDFPLALFGIFDLLLYPLFLGFIIYQSVLVDDKSALLVSFLMLPILFFLLVGNKIKISDNEFKYIFIMPFLFAFINLIEFYALIKAIFRTVTKKKTVWTNWDRQGIVE